jgi:hypothetical protein
VPGHSLSPALAQVAAPPEFRAASVQSNAASNQTESPLLALTFQDALDRAQRNDLAAEDLPLNIARYQTDEAKAFEVVDAQNDLIKARNALDDGELRYRVAIANLQTLTGSF